MCRGERNHVRRLLNPPSARSAAPHSARHNVATLSACSEPQIEGGLLPASDCGSSLSFFDLRPHPFLEVRSVRIRNRIVFVLQLGTLFEEVPNTLLSPWFSCDPSDQSANANPAHSRGPCAWPGQRICVPSAASARPARR